jgi:hypothetical protein
MMHHRLLGGLWRVNTFHLLFTDRHTSMQWGNDARAKSLDRLDPEIGRVFSFDFLLLPFHFSLCSLIAVQTSFRCH